jgi:hypothetical protein
MYHDIGYRRVKMNPASTGPGYGFIGWNEYISVDNDASPYEKFIGTARCVSHVTHSGPPQLEEDTGIYRGLVYWWPESTRTAWGDPT